MGEFQNMFRMLSHVVGNVQAVNRLNDGADRIVKRMTGLPTRAFNKQYRDAIYDRVKHHYLNNLGPEYEPTEVAAFKLLCYSKQEMPHPFNKRIEEALRAIAAEVDRSRAREELMELTLYC